jgi:hypothetical protein
MTQWSLKPVKQLKPLKLLSAPLRLLGMTRWLLKPLKPLKLLSAPFQVGAVEPAVLKVTELINRRAIEVGQNMKALRQLRLGAGSYAEALEVLVRQSSDSTDHYGRFEVRYKEGVLAQKLGIKARRSCYTPGHMGAFALPKVLRVLCRLEMDVFDIDMKAGHFQGMCEMISEWGLQPRSFPMVLAVASAREEFIDRVLRPAMPWEKDFKQLILSVAFGRRREPCWPEAPLFNSFNSFCVGLNNATPRQNRGFQQFQQFQQFC